jgi:acyl carrier protein
MPEQRKSWTQQEVEGKVIQAVAQALDIEPETIQLSTALQAELGAESLDYLDIAFSLERDFRIQFPRADLLRRASEYFGEDTLVKDGLVTDLGLEMLRRGMPELDPEQIKPGLLAVDVPRMFTVATFVRVVMRLLEAKKLAPATCDECGAPTVESATTPEFLCTSCGKSFLPPSSDDILFQELVELSKLKHP